MTEKNTQTSLIMLGTGNAMATQCYNTCFALRTPDGQTLLVDAGGGNFILGRLEEAGLSLGEIHDLFVTHAHTDHVLGVIWIIRKIGAMMNSGKYEGEFHIYCHRELGEVIRAICGMTMQAKFTDLIGTRILLRLLEDGETFSCCGMQLTAFDIGSTKMKQFGFQAVLPDGQKFTCLGDEPYKECCSSYVKDADWLLCEAFCLYEDRHIFKPYEKHHSTVADAGKLAETLGVKNLLLYHTEDQSLETRKQRYSREAASVFHGNVFVPDDLDVIRL